VRMVSEGVDVPRLAVGVYATNASTPLFFAQAVGRFVRCRTAGETASIFLPSVPSLLQLASELEAQRNHVLGKPHRESLGFDEPEERRRSEPAEADNGFEFLGSDAELDQVIFDGASFGTATPAGSEEEADYLGIPGLLDTDQMRDLLRRRQEEQLAGRSRSGGDIGQRSRSGGDIGQRSRSGGDIGQRSRSGGDIGQPRTTYGQLRELRRELNTLVAATHHRTGRTHGWIHKELRRICGGPPIAAADSEQLQARIEAVRSLKV